jgi:hypothetical protein
MLGRLPMVKCARILRSQQSMLDPGRASGAGCFFEPT